MAISGLSEPVASAAPHFTFFLGDEEYGLPLGRVVEIAPQEGLTRVPGTPDLLCGVASIRGLPVAVVDLARKFGLPVRVRPTRQSLVVVQADVAPGALMAIVADRIGGVVEVLEHDVEPVPPLSSGIRTEFLLGMVRRDRGFVLLLDLPHVLTASEREALTGLLEAEGSPSPAEEPSPTALRTETGPAVAGGRTRRFVIVNASGLRLGIDASWVQEVTAAVGVTVLPGAAPSFHGLLNLRGAVLPVLDLGAAMGQASFAARARAAFLVLDPPEESERGQAGLAVDAVLGMVELGPEGIEGVPSFASPAPVELIEGTALAGGRPTLIVDLATLLSR